MRVAVGRTQGEVAVAGRARGDAATEARVIALLTRHEASLMRVARQWSICQDDAYDALQRGLEIYVRRIATIDPATEAAWLKVVVIRTFVNAWRGAAGPPGCRRRCASHPGRLRVAIDSFRA